MEQINKNNTRNIHSLRYIAMYSYNYRISVCICNDNFKMKDKAALDMTVQVPPWSIALKVFLLQNQL